MGTWPVGPVCPPKWQQAEFGSPRMALPVPACLHCQSHAPLTPGLDGLSPVILGGPPGEVTEWHTELHHKPHLQVKKVGGR